MTNAPQASSSPESASPESAARAAHTPAPLDGFADQAALRRMASILVHRLSGLTSAVAGYTDLLTDTLGTAEQRQMALRIFEGVAGIDRILADLQRFSRPLKPARRLVRLEEVTDGLAALLEEADWPRVQWAVEAPAACVLRVDALLLRQALLLLLQNALEATEPPVPVRFRAVLDACTVRFEVWNEGHIDLDDPARVFDPFFTTRARNLGVGLPLARGIARAHGGALHLSTDAAAQQICFALHLPCEDAPPPCSARPSRRA